MSEHSTYRVIDHTLSEGTATWWLEWVGRKYKLESMVVSSGLSVVLIDLGKLTTSGFQQVEHMMLPRGTPHEQGFDRIMRVCAWMLHLKPPRLKDVRPTAWERLDE